MDDHGPTPYPCNIGSPLSQENVTTRPKELEVAVARNHIKVNPSGRPRIPRPKKSRPRACAGKSTQQWRPSVAHCGAIFRDESGWLVRDSEEESNGRHFNGNHRTEHTMVYKRLLGRLVEERLQEEQHVTRLTEEIRARERAYSGGFSGMD